ncbi:MAG TPA: CdaR family protein [Bryobacteraceae bacterium]|nr:CdaR family protein [Bryobacteraceae bacterium]
MLGLFTHNIGWKLLSLAAAVLLWISVASEPELSTLHSVPVEYKGMPDGLEISSNFVENVFLELRGPAGRLRDLRDTRPAVVLDFSRVQGPGERTVTIDQTNVSLPRGIQMVRAIPAQLRFRFERRIARQVPVVVRFSPPHEGYSIAQYTVDPPKLTITGPESAVSGVKTLATDPIDIGGVVSSHEFRANTYLAEPEVRFQSDSHVRVSVIVKKN